MTVKRKIKIFIIDDSLLFRETLAKELSADTSLEVVGKASDPFDAKDKVIDLKPDVLILDVEMPRMNGIEFLKRLMPQYPLPVVVVSAASKNVFESLKAGAVDFVAKPDVKAEGEFKRFISEIKIKVKIASTAKVGNEKRAKANNNVLKVDKKTDDYIIAIGASTGGTEAIFNVIKDLPKDIPGIVIVQHMPPVFTKMYSERLNNSCNLEVKEAQDGDLISKGRVLIAPGDFQMSILKDNNGYFVRCRKGEKVSGHCPSVDVLFNSVAKIARNRSLGVILTGMGADGAKGLLEMRKQGSHTIGQDEKSCVVYGMPMVAYNIGAVEKQVPLEKISAAIVEGVKKFA